MVIQSACRKKITLPCGIGKKKQHLQCLSALTAIFMIKAPDQQTI